MVLRNRFRILISLCILSSAVFCRASEDTWTEVRSPNFIVISNASPKQARRTARSFEQFRGLLQTALKLKVDPGSPLVVFAVRNSQDLKAFLPKDRQEKGEMQLAGYFQSGQERNFVVLRLDVTGDQGYHVIYHEYVHMVMRLNFQSLPVWLNEGLAEFFGYANVSHEPASLGDYSLENLQVLRSSPMIPLATLMAVKHDSPYYHREEKARILYAQSWVIAHYLMLGDKGAHAKQLNELMSLLQKGVPEQEAEERALGDLKALEKNLRNYTQLTAFYHYQIPLRLNVNEDQYAARTLSPAESLAMRGQLLVQLNRLDDARGMLGQASQLDPRCTDAQEGMGLLFLRLSDQEQAKKYFSAAANLDSKSFLAQFYAAQLAYEKDGDYTAAESYLRKALAINPQFAPSYRILSHVLMTQKERLPEALEAGIKAAELEPAELSHGLNVCIILINMGRYDEANSLAGRILNVAKTEAEQRQAESVLFEIKDRQDRILEAKRREEALKEAAKRREEERQAIRESAEQHQTETAARKQPTEPPALKIKTGPAGKVKGLIRSVKCGYPAIMDVVLDSSGKQQRLRAENYYDVQYWAVAAAGRSEFEPCEELPGKQVEIEYLSVTGQEYSGFIKTIAIEK